MTTMGTSTIDASTVGREYPKWHNGVSGAFAGAGARFFTAPLDLLRIRRQLSATMSKEAMWRSLWRIASVEGGIQSLYRGNISATCLWFGYSAIQFSLYEQISESLKSSANAPNYYPPWTWIQTIATNSAAVAFVSGATAGVCATLVTYPFDLFRTVFAARGLQPNTSSLMPVSSTFRPPKTIWGFAQSLLAKRGIQGFFAGSGAAVVQIVPYMGFSFAVYDTLTRLSDREGLLGNSGIAGAIAGGSSKLLVYPMDTVKK